MKKYFKQLLWNLSMVGIFFLIWIAIIFYNVFIFIIILASFISAFFRSEEKMMEYFDILEDSIPCPGFANKDKDKEKDIIDICDN